MGQVAYSIADAALATATTEATINEAIRDKRLRARAVGNGAVIAHTALVVWIESLPAYNP